MKRLKILLLILLLSCGLLAAQTPTGKIIGKVTDVEGMALPGVSVSAESPKLLGGAVAITDATGTFRIVFFLSVTTLTSRSINFWEKWATTFSIKCFRTFNVIFTY